MTTIIFPNNTTEVINSIRDAIGRIVYFNVVSSAIACNICSLDPVTNTSTNSFCVVCSGNYWIDQIDSHPILAHVNWGKGDISKWETGGIYLDGDCTIQIEYTDTNVDIVEKTKFVVVDNRELEIKSKYLKGVPELNRIILNLMERNKQ